MSKRTNADICEQLGIPVWQWVALMGCGLLLKPFFFVAASLISLRANPQGLRSDGRASAGTRRHDAPLLTPANDPHAPIILAQAPR